MRGRDWAIKLKAATVNPDINDVVVIGAGYIGIEAAEVFAKAGKHVTVIDLADRILPLYLDSEFTEPLTSSLEQHGLTVATGHSVQRFEGQDGTISKVVTDKALLTPIWSSNQRACAPIPNG
jgi:NADH peroxidase